MNDIYMYIVRIISTTYKLDISRNKSYYVNLVVTNSIFFNTTLQAAY